MKVIKKRVKSKLNEINNIKHMQIKMSWKKIKISIIYILQQSI
jgi:hypothetical protein